MHSSSTELMKHFISKYANGQPGNRPLKVLDIGSLDVNGSYRDLFPMPAYLYRGLDIVPGKNVDIVARGPYNYSSIVSNSIDIIISGQTLEHVQAIWQWILELERVLRPNGLICIIAPSAFMEHRFPVDCWRILRDGMRFLLGEHAGLTVLEARTEGMDTIGIARKK